MIPAVAAEPLRHILVAHDDAAVRAQVGAYFGEHGYAVHVVGSEAAMDAVLAAHPVEVVILDVLLPGEGGLSICRRLAEAGGPGIIMLGGDCEEVDRVVGLELGADDYLPESCSPRELLARVRALVRRFDEARASPQRRARGYRFMGFAVKATHRQVRAPNGTEILLTPGESALLSVFLQHPRRILTREQLLEMAHGTDGQVLDRAVDVQISRLRRKLNAAVDKDVIRTVRGAGYIFDVEVTRL
jgi:two-component system OmpR family response regulator